MLENPEDSVSKVNKERENIQTRERIINGARFLRRWRE